MSFVSLFAQSSYYTQDINAADSAAAAGAIIFFILFMAVAVAITYVITSYLLSRIFKKAGVESWRAWVPIYSNWVMLELGGQKGYWAVLALIPFVNIVSAIFMFIAMYHIGLRLGKEGVFILLGVFLPLAWYVWLAFDSSTWKGPRQITSPASSPVKDPGTPTTPATK